MRELELEFKGRGEVKNHLFTQKYFDGAWYIYEVIHLDNPDAIPHYEVFKRIEKPVNPPFAPEPFVRYPSSNVFGVGAWTAKTYERALEIIQERSANRRDPQTQPEETELFED